MSYNIRVCWNSKPKFKFFQPVSGLLKFSSYSSSLYLILIKSRTVRAHRALIIGNRPKLNAKNIILDNTGLEVDIN